jgi:hypothetical protein
MLLRNRILKEQWLKVNIIQKEGRVKSVPRRKQGQALNVKGFFQDLREESDQNTPCGLKYVYFSIFSVQNVAGSRARNVKRGIMKCVLGAAGRKQFICGNACISAA